MEDVIILGSYFVMIYNLFIITLHISLYKGLFTNSRFSKLFLNQARAWFLKIDPVRIVGMLACVCVCVSAPEAINN